VEDLLKNGEIDLVINTSDNKASKDDARRIRQAVLRFNIPYFTTLAAARVTAEAIAEMRQEEALAPRALQDYLSE
jgi:carbamoyl-phosphate synthase large subunit